MCYIHLAGNSRYNNNFFFHNISKRVIHNTRARTAEISDYASGPHLVPASEPRRNA